MSKENKLILELCKGKYTNKEALNEAVSEVKISSRLKSHPVSLSAVEGMSFEMEKVLKFKGDYKIN